MRIASASLQFFCLNAGTKATYSISHKEYQYWRNVRESAHAIHSIPIHHWSAEFQYNQYMR